MCPSLGLHSSFRSIISHFFSLVILILTSGAPSKMIVSFLGQAYSNLIPKELASMEGSPEDTLELNVVSEKDAMQ